MIIPLGIAAFIAWRLWRNRHGSGVLTFERKVIYRKLLRSTDSVTLEKFAKLFDSQGLKNEASILRNRALLRSHPDQVLQQRQNALKSALASNDPSAIEKIGDGFAQQGATNTAEYLYQYAESLRTLSAIPPIVAPAQPAQSPVVPPQQAPSEVEAPVPQPAIPTQPNANG